MFEALEAARGRGRPVVLVTVVAVEGEPPSHPGAKLVVDGGEVLAGTLGCSEFDSAGRALAGELTGAPQSADQRVTLRRREVFGHGGAQALDLFAERYDPQPGMTILGDTPVGRALGDIGELVGRRVARLGDSDPAAALRSQPPGPADALVVSDHDAPYVDEVLRLALSSPAGFVGMLGSRRHAPEVVRRLREAGTRPAQLSRLRSPCGLDIGSRTPPEIALSIMAEILAVERDRDGGPMGVDWSASGS